MEKSFREMEMEVLVTSVCVDIKVAKNMECAGTF